MTLWIDNIGDLCRTTGKPFMVVAEASTFRSGTTVHRFTHQATATHIDKKRPAEIQRAHSRSAMFWTFKRFASG